METWKGGRNRKTLTNNPSSSPIRIKCYIARGDSVSLVVGHNLDLAVLHDGNATVRCAEVDSDNGLIGLECCVGGRLGLGGACKGEEGELAEDDEEE